MQLFFKSVLPRPPCSLWGVMEQSLEKGKKRKTGLVNVLDQLRCFFKSTKIIINVIMNPITRVCGKFSKQKY